MQPASHAEQPTLYKKHLKKTQLSANRVFDCQNSKQSRTLSGMMKLGRVMSQLFIAGLLLLLSSCAHHHRVGVQSDGDQFSSRQADVVSNTDTPKPDIDQKVKPEPPVIISSALNPMTPVGRYSLVSATPTEQQSELLSVMVTVTMPEPIQTVGDAIHHVLRPSGYQLARFDAQGLEVLQLLQRPLPQSHRTLGPMPLQDILLTLATPAFRLHIDPVHRLIAYDLKPEYTIEYSP